MADEKKKQPEEMDFAKAYKEKMLQALGMGPQEPDETQDEMKKAIDLRMEAHDSYLKEVSQKKYLGKRPNIVLVFVDDMGYGDISCFGSKAIKTPNLDKLAQNGLKVNNFYAASPVCSPSRFSCLTGRYPNRSFFNGVAFPTDTPMGMLRNKAMFEHGVLGILPDEITSAEALKAAGYDTAMFGKWHMGDRAPSLPNDKGFGYFYGALYSVDMSPYAFYKNKEIDIPAEVDKDEITPILTKQILGYIDQHHEKPFFIYYASPYPHFPAHASKAFKGHSQGGTYGDCVEEIDWSVGEIMKKLDQYDLTDNTLVIFTSDNGPWQEGNPGLHRGRKCQNFDGGQAVPFIASWPLVIKPGSVTDEAMMNTDFFPTFLQMAGVDLPTDRAIDGHSLLPFLAGETNISPDDKLYFIRSHSEKRIGKALAVRSRDKFKYMGKAMSDNAAYITMEQGPFLFNLENDPNESYDVTPLFPKKAEELNAEMEKVNEDFASNPRGWKSAK
jgi:arylsulfatase A-like enzyme